MGKEIDSKLDKEETALLKAENDEILTSVLPDFMSSGIDSMGLTPQEVRYIYEYIASGMNNATDAYSTAYGEDNKTKCRLHAKALLKKPTIIAGIDTMLSLFWKKAEKILPLQLLAQLEASMTYSLSDFYMPDMSIKPLDQIPLAKQQLIRNRTVTINNKSGAVIYGYELADKSAAIASLMNLIKVKTTITEASGEGTKDGDSMAEARAMRDAIFGGYNATIL
jgi:hypothetical protein